MTHTDDPYSRVDYRRLIAWPQRIEREWPFLERVLATAPTRRILDLGCGTGEHARFLGSHGFEVVGVDSSPTMLAKAMEPPLPAGVSFVEGDIIEVGSLVTGEFGAAICLGNTLPHVREAAALDNLIGGLGQRLHPSAPFVLQVLNYERILRTKQRFLPLNFRTDDAGGEIVFLRLMDPRPDGTVIFTPSTLRYRPDGDPPLEVVSARNVLLRGWTRGDLEDALARGGFAVRDFYGTVGTIPYEPRESPDLVVVARRPS
jgi:glycine/sarcosine N-methyltransferase